MTELNNNIELQELDEVTGGALDGTPEITCEATKESSVGIYDIIVKRGTETNYNVTYVKGTLTIKKAPLTVKAGTYTRKQGEENPEFTLEYEGFKNNETEAVLTKKPTATTTATKTSAPGDYPVTISGGEAKNYTFSYVNGTLTIESIPNDVNADGTIDVNDIIAITNFIAGKTGNLTIEKADVNGDNKVDIADVIMLVNILLK